MKWLLPQKKRSFEKLRASAFREPAAAVIKHTNPCGVARRDSISAALRAAIDADPVSAFGGIVSTNREFDDASARAVDALFLEVIVAPSFSDEAREIRQKMGSLLHAIGANGMNGVSAVV